MSIQRMPRLKKTRAKISAGMDTDAIYEYILNERIRRENEKT
jgi:hypothetical protein